MAEATGAGGTGDEKGGRPPASHELITDAAKLRDAERAFIDGKSDVPDRPMSGIALTGGGIRSGTFALGALQALASNGLLEKFDYVSSVSGGGYASCSLRWLLHANPRLNDTGANFPYTQTATGNILLDHLRNHADYLRPQGMSNATGIAAVLRAMFLNLVVWLPLLILVSVVVTWIGHWPVPLGWLINWLHDPMMGLIGNRWANANPDGLRVYSLILVIALLLLALAVIGAIIYSLRTFRNFWHRSADGTSLYEKRRRNEINAGRMLVWFGVALAFGAIPLVSAGLLYLGDKALGVVNLAAEGRWRFAISVVMLLAGMGALVPVIRQTLANLQLSNKVGITAPLGCALFLYGLLVLAFHIGFTAFGPIADVFAGNTAMIDGTTGGLLVFFALSIVVAVATGLLVNTNNISIHRFYRDRLMEALMPNVRADGSVEGNGRTDADDFRLSAIYDDQYRRPYPLIGCHVVLTDSEDPKVRRRGGDSFLLSPLYCGSSAIGGWVDTRAFNRDSMTVPTAMAISGAAVNPSTGASGTGPTMNRFVGMTMALLNLRLGYWVRRPEGTSPGKLKWPPNHFCPGLYALGKLCGGYDEDSGFLQISDGGHFDNSALYELFRREVSFILFVDAGGDPGYKFENLINALRRSQEDFPGLEFEPVAPGGTLALDAMVARTEVAYPDKRKVSATAHAVLKFRYGKDPAGTYPATLVYLKLTTTADTSMLVKGYQAQNDKFPHDPTLDQFFDPDQFDAYYRTGQELAEAVIAGVAPPNSTVTGLKALLAHAGF